MPEGVNIFLYTYNADETGKLQLKQKCKQASMSVCILTEIEENLFRK